MTIAHQPVQWQVTPQKTGPGQYNINLRATMQPGWYLYVQPDAAEGIESLAIQWDNDIVTSNDDLLLQTKPTSIHDAVFNKQLLVSETQVAFSQSIVIKGAVPSSIKVVLQAYATNGKEFLALNPSLSVGFENSTSNAAVPAILANIDLKNQLAGCSDQQPKDQGLVTTFLLSLFGGLIAFLHGSPSMWMTAINYPQNKGLPIRIVQVSKKILLRWKINMTRCNPCILNRTRNLCMLSCHLEASL